MQFNDGGRPVRQQQQQMPQPPPQQAGPPQNNFPALDQQDMQMQQQQQRQPMQPQWQEPQARVIQNDPSMFPRQRNPGDMNAAPIQRYNQRTGWIGNQQQPNQGLRAPASEIYSPARHQHVHRDQGIVDGNTRRTWSSNPDPFYSSDPSPQLVTMSTPNGRPMHGEFELWEGPNNTPQKVRVYSEDGARRPFQTLVQPRAGTRNTMSIQNHGPLEFPMQAGVQQAHSRPSIEPYRAGTAHGTPMTTVQGGSLKTFQVGHGVQQVLIEMQTEGGQIQATVELWEGPGAARQVAEIYHDDGSARPFSALLDTSGWYGSTIAVRNTGVMEFPIRVSVKPYS